MTHHSKTRRAIAVDLYETGLSTHAVASQMGLSSSTVARWLRIAGVMRMKTSRADELQGAVVKDSRAGYSVSQIAKRHELPKTTIYTWLQMHRDGMLRPPGPAPSNSELSKDQRDAMGAREALKAWPARPLPDGGWYSSGFFGGG